MYPNKTTMNPYTSTAHTASIFWSCALFISHPGFWPMHVLSSVLGGSTMLQGAALNLVWACKAGKYTSKEVLYLCPPQEEGQNADLGGQRHHPAGCTPHQNTCLFASLLERKADHDTEGALLAESKHKTSELSDICRVSKFVTLWVDLCFVPQGWEEH